MDAKKRKTQLIPGTGGLVKRAVATLATAAIPRLGRESPVEEFAANTFLLMDIAAHCRNATEHIVVCGGYGPSYAWTKGFYTFSADRNTWTRGPDMLVGRSCYGGARADDGRIFVFGATMPGPQYGGCVFDPVGNRWTETPHMHQARRRAGVAGLNGRIFVIGGADGLAPLSACEALAVDTLEWTVTLPMPTAKYGMGVATIGHCIYTIGGSTNEDTPLPTVEKLDTATGTWTALPPMPIAVTRMAVAVIYDRFIWVLGGLGPEDLNALIEIFDTMRNMWLEPKINPAPRVGASAVAVGSMIYVIGGYGRRGRTYQNEILNTDTLTWLPGPDCPNCPDYAAAVIGY
ncbi:MAG: hypothetical protein M0R22_04250 [Dehalococcoidia bacterium]|jgi:hypothetical protein|nr:hypothetical protein [Dehalococcoidia bacterium]